MATTEASKSAHEDPSRARNPATVGSPQSAVRDAGDSMEFGALLDMFDDVAAFEAPREYNISAAPSPGSAEAEGAVIVGTSDRCRARVCNVRVGDHVTGVVLVSTGDGTPVLAFVNADKGIAREYYAPELLNAQLGPWTDQQLLARLAATRFLGEHVVATVNADALLERRLELPTSWDHILRARE